MTPETLIKTHIKNWLKGEEWSGRLTWWNNVAGIGSWPGLGDISVIKNGRYYEFEVKSERGKPSEKQLRRQQIVNNHEGNYCIVKSWEEVEKILKSDGFGSGLDRW